MYPHLKKFTDNYNDLGYDIEIERYYRTLCKPGSRVLVVFFTRVCDDACGLLSLGILIGNSNAITIFITKNANKTTEL